MRYRVKITASANETGKKFPPEIKKELKKAQKELARNPNSGKALQAELSAFRSYRFKRYRIIYKVDAENLRIVVWAIGHRRDIYEKFGEYLLELKPDAKS